MPISRPIVSEFPVEEELTDEEKRRRGWTYDPVLGWQPPVKPPISPDMSAWLPPEFLEQKGLIMSEGMIASRKQLGEVGQWAGFPVARSIKVGEPPPTGEEWALSAANLALLASGGVGGIIGGTVGKAVSAGLQAGAAGVFGAETAKHWEEMPEWQRAFSVVLTAAIGGVALKQALSLAPIAMRASIGREVKAALASERGAIGYPEENPYMKMPIERVRKDADYGVKAAQEALAVREGKAPPVAVPEGKPSPTRPGLDITPIWERTQADILAQAEASSKALGRDVESGRNVAIRVHKEEIVKALSEGKPVPSEVLKEYPDLAARETPRIQRPAREPAREIERVQRPAKITKDMESRLKAMGVTEAEIAKMTPQQAWEKLGIKAPAVPPIEKVTPEVTEKRSPVDIILRREPEPLLPSGFKYSAFDEATGLRVGVGEETAEATESRVRSYLNVKSVRVEGEAIPKAEAGMPVEAAKPPAAPPSEVQLGSKVIRPPVAPPPQSVVPPVEPPKPPVGGGVFPSGRKPGGIGRQTPYTPPDPVEQLVDALTPTRLTAGDRVTNFVEGTQRKFYDNLYVGLNELERKTGVPAYTLARLTRGAVAAGEDNIRRFIRPILDSVSDDIQRLEEYMVLHRNMDIIGRNPSARLPGNMTAGGTIKAMESMETKLGAERFAKIDQAARELWQKNDELILTRLKNAGMLDGESYTRIKSANPHYIDFGRADFDIDDVARIIKNPEASVTGTGMQRLTEGGSVRKLDEPLASSLRQFANVEVLVSRNEAAKNIVLGLQKLEKQTGEKLVTLLEEGAKAEHSLITDTISFLQDGKKLTYQVPRRYAISAKGLEAESANAFSRVAQIASAPLRHGAVTYNPAFVIINPMRDALSAWFREGLIPFSPSYIRGWQAAIMKNADFTEVAQARVLMSGIVDTMRSTKAITAQAGRGALSVRSWQDALTILPRLVAEANLTAERATRIATYYKLKGKGIPELERALRSRDVSVDFAKMGDVMKLINQAIPFTNAGLQGTLNVARTIREKPLWAIAAASPLVMTSILAWVNNKRFETSSKIPAYEQSYSWVLQVGEGIENPDPKQPFKEPEKFPIYIKVPKGPMGSALTVPVELMLRLAWATNNRSVLEELLQSGRGLATAVLPVEPSVSGVLPPLLSTAVGLQTGQDVFRGQPIVPFREEQRLPEQQFGAEISTLAIELGQKFKVSPRLIDFAIKDYTAGTGQMGLWIVGMALEALGAKPEVYGEAFVKEPSAAQAQVRVPLISRFVGTRATGEEIFDRKAFRDIAEASQRNIAKFPDINRLGITFGDVGDTVAGAVLDIKQRTQYQTVAGQRAEQELFTLFNSPSYSRLSDTEKRQAIQGSLDVARERARGEIAPTLGVASFARFEIVKRGGSIAQFEKLTGLKWDDPKAETLITGAHRYLKTYWDIENKVWSGYDPRLKQLSDMLEKLSQTDEKKAKDFLFQVPEIMWARREVLLQKRVMRQDNPTLEAILQLFY